MRVELNADFVVGIGPKRMVVHFIYLCCNFCHEGESFFEVSECETSFQFVIFFFPHDQKNLGLDTNVIAGKVLSNEDTRIKLVFKLCGLIRDQVYLNFDSFIIIIKTIIKHRFDRRLCLFGLGLVVSLNLFTRKI